jgi:hypothetical protein
MSVIQCIKRFLFGAPGWIVFGMTALWLTPFCIRDVRWCPACWDSHLLYVVIYGVSLFTVFGLNSLELITGFWSRSRLLKRVLVAWVGYTFAMFTSFVIILSLDSARKLRFYGGDAGGSSGLFIWPSVILYGIIGLAVCGVAAFIRAYQDFKA